MQEHLSCRWQQRITQNDRARDQDQKNNQSSCELACARVREHVGYYM